ncbi:uncharacterized protein [Amphiura filiformis]|uniref:uncharacterized protein n=1 Tax=Amphiura filiformis TaxID=82378 RepID=UPI003B218A43
MKQEIEVLISRVITDYLKCLKHLKPIVQQHIPHKNSTQTVKKSDVNKLGLLKLDEMQSGDMIEIMTTVEDQCCPKTMERLYQILLGGDGLSTFNAWSAKRGRADGFNATDSLAGVIPKPEDWHEGVICLQDVFTYGYIHKSTCEKGTLYNLREVFDRRGVKASAKNAVNDNREFLKFITHGYVVLAAMQVLGIDEFEESPVGIPSQQDPVEVRQAYLQEISTAIVDRFVFPHGVLPSGSCSTDHQEDYKYNYICAVMREGLLDIARLDAVREGDGERIIRHWRYDFVHFHAYNHPNYRLISFRMIAQIYALLTPRMAARVMHNRTVNVHGGVGRISHRISSWRSCTRMSRTT